MSTRQPLEELLSHLQGIKRASSNRHMAKCPAHNDSTASLQITEGQDGKILVHCFAGCTTDSVLSSVGMKVADLFADDKPRPEPDAVYTYQDERGKLLYQVVRKAGKNFLQRQPDGKGSWDWNIKGVRRVPYRLPELIAADPSRAVFVVEGEKDADRLALLGCVATSNNGGAGNWPPDFAGFLLERTVVVLPDNDPPGRSHALDVARSAFDVADRVKVIYLPDLADKEDVSDWLDRRGGSLERLRELVKHTPDWSPDSAEAESTVEPELPTPPKWDIQALADLEVSNEDVGWIWQGYIVRKMITLLSGYLKSGKTTLLAYLLKSLDGLAYNFAGLPVGDVKRILLVTEEHSDLWAMRKDEIGIASRVDVLCQPFMASPTLAEWIGLINDIADMVEFDGYDLVIFDPIHNLWGVKSETDNAEGRVWGLPLKAIVNRGAALLLLAHTGKDEKGFGKNNRGASVLGGMVDILVEFRQYNSDSMTDTRRILEAKSRFRDTPTQLVVDYVAGQGYIPQGTKQEADKQARWQTLRNILPTSSPGYTTKEILAEWPEEELKPSRNTLASDLNFAFSTGGVIQRSLSEPYTYYYAQTNEQWQHKSA